MRPHSRLRHIHLHPNPPEGRGSRDSGDDETFAVSGQATVHEAWFLAVGSTSVTIANEITTPPS